MYCIKCGAKLSDGQTLCPLCETKVYHPDFVVEAKDTYPKIPFKSEEFNRTSLMFVITMVFLLPLIIPIVLELGWHDRINWSGYVAGGTLLFYIIFILPCWFKRPNPVVFIPSDFAAIVLFLLYICIVTEGDWFMSFAFPAFGALGLLVSGVTALLHYVKRGALYTIGGGLILLGGWTVLLEFLIRTAFNVDLHFYWSGASLTVFFVIGAMLIVINTVKPMKESLRRIFFIGEVKI